MASPPISFSINQGLEHVTRADLVTAAQAAEARGYVTFTVADHFNTPMAPFTALAVAAEATSTLRVAPYVLDNDFRHPSITAREVATIDELTGGRFDFGIGAGWKQPEYLEAGFVFDRAGVRISRLAEALQVFEQLFSGQPTSFHGEHYDMDGLVLRPISAERPPPPLMIGGGSPRILRLASTWADIVSVAVKATPTGRIDSGDSTAEALEQKMQWVREAAGGRFDQLTINAPLMDVMIGSDARALARRKLDELRSPDSFLAWTKELTEDDLLASPYFFFGTVSDIIEHARASHDRFGVSSYSILGRTTTDLSPVVEALRT